MAWLAEAEGARCVGVLGYDDISLTLERLTAVPPTVADARRFGQQLAITHDAGADGFGAAPSGWSGQGFFGPLHQPLPMSLIAFTSWGRFYAEQRLTPMLHRVGDLNAAVRDDLVSVVERCAAGEFDDNDEPARLHGDLWSGNLMWTASGVVLIDPAAHGGHRETDLAMLALFGCPHLGAIYDGYQQVHPLREGWRDRIALHQLYPLLAHVALFGSGYAGQTAAAARAVLALS